MKVLWAPWRMQYILSKKPGGCIFCDLPGEQRDRENLILLRRKGAYVIMNRFPYNNGHLLIAPYAHEESIDGLTAEERAQMMELTNDVVRCLKKEMRPEGFNIGVNIGTAAGAGYGEHVHIHVVPRWAGDSGFMTVLGEINVVSEHLLQTYDKLYPLLNEDAQGTENK